MIKNRYWRWSVLAAVIILSLVAAGCSGLGSQSGSSSDSGDVQTGEVETISTVENVEASGSVEAAQDASLYWKTNGIVEQVNVQPGDDVQAGDVLATLDPTSVPASVLAAQVDLINGEISLENLAPTALAIAQSEQSIASLEEQVDTLQDRVDGLGQPASQADIEQAKATVLLAKIQMDKAWDRYKPWQNKPESNPVRASLYNRWASAQQSYDLAVRRLNNLQGTGVNNLDRLVAEANLKLSQANLEDARERLAELKAGADPQDVAAVEARITAAKATLSALQLTAPFAGEILAVDVQPGDVVSPNQTALTLADRERMHVNTLVDETDIAAVLVGDQAVITLDAFPGKELTGKVGFINPMGQSIQGNVKYEVRIDLDPLDNPLLLGATADVMIQTGAPQESLVVPVRAIQSDDNGEFVIVILDDGTQQRVDITSGQLSGDQVVVTGNLQVGDRVLLPEASNDMFNRMNQMGGGG